jgi:hypothetical protein
MQIAMVGLGRMGANMVRRLMRAGHECVVYDHASEPITALQNEGAIPSHSFEEMCGKMQTPRAVWLMVPAAVVDDTLAALTPHLEPGDIVIDGGNSYYVDDRRCLRTGTWLLPDDRRRHGCGGCTRSHLQDARPRCRIRGPHTWPRQTTEDSSRGWLSALRACWSGPLRQDGTQRH